MKKKEIRALISLLDDDDLDVYDHVKSKLLSFGEEVVPELENMWEFDRFEGNFQDRVLDVLHQIQINTVSQGLEEWNNNDNDLLQGFYLINKFHYPDNKRTELEQVIERISKSIWLELNDKLTAFEIVRIVNHVLFVDFGFQANKNNYHSPTNSYLSDVLHNKRGNPLSLCVIYQLVAEKLGLPIRGVNLPNHFILAYIDEHKTNRLIDKPTSDILFYINPFSGGSILGEQEINSFLAQLQIEPDDEYFNPCSNKAMVKRSLNNLMYSYAREGNQEKVNELKALERLLS